MSGTSITFTSSIKKESIMTRTEVENILNAYYPRFIKHVQYEHTNRLGDTLIETAMWKNRWVQYCYDSNGNIKGTVLVMVEWTYGLNRIACKEAHSIDELKKHLGL